MDETQLYQAIGAGGLERLIAGFYRRVPADPILGPMYPEDDLVGAEARLRDFLAYRLGGPDHYLHTRGHPRLRMRHAPFAIDRGARDRWVALMRAAAAEADLPPAATGPLLAFLEDVATFLINRP